MTLNEYIDRYGDGFDPDQIIQGLRSLIHSFGEYHNVPCPGLIVQETESEYQDFDRYVRILEDIAEIATDRQARVCDYTPPGIIDDPINNELNDDLTITDYVRRLKKSEMKNPQTDETLEELQHLGEVARDARRTRY